MGSLYYGHGYSEWLAIASYDRMRPADQRLQLQVTHIPGWTEADTLWAMGKLFHARVLARASGTEMQWHFASRCPHCKAEIEVGLDLGGDPVTTQNVT